LDAGVAFDAVFAFDAGLDAFVAAAFAAVFLAPVFALEVFFVVAAFAVGFLAVVVVFFFTTGFFAGAFFVVVVLVVFLTGAAFLAVVPLAFVEAAGFFVVDDFLTAGLEFSLLAEALTFGASLTFPEGPLGNTNVPFSAPLAMALFSWYRFVPLVSILYLVSAYYRNKPSSAIEHTSNITPFTFLIVARETP
jgi:hypothetical protein